MRCRRYRWSAVRSALRLQTVPKTGEARVNKSIRGRLNCHSLLPLLLCVACAVHPLFCAPPCRASAFSFRHRPDPRVTHPSPLLADLGSRHSSSALLSHGSAMSRRRAANKRKADGEVIAVEEDGQEERKEDKRSRADPAAAAAAASSSSAAAVASSSLSAVSAASSASHPRGELEEVVCSACYEPFGWADDSAHLPRTLPCGHPLCIQCCKQSLTLTPGSVLCPHEHGQIRIAIAGGVAAAAVSTAETWLRLLPPSSALIAALRNQASLMTRLGRQGARCSRSGCDSVVTHYCPEPTCGDLCSEHERKRHSLAMFQSHKASTVPIAQKAATFQCKLAGPAAMIRAKITDAVLQQQKEANLATAELKQIRLQAEQKERILLAKEKALAALRQTADRMAAADDSGVLDIEAERLEAAGPTAASARPLFDSAILHTLDESRVAALQSFLGAARPPKLIYRGSRDGFKASDWFRLCGGKSNLLTIIRAKGNGFVFGAFTPFQWPLEPVKVEGECIADPSGATFLFSLVNAHKRAVKLRLKKCENYRAGMLWKGYGPSQPTFEPMQLQS